MRNDLNWFIEEGILCLHDGCKTYGMWLYIFQWCQSSIVVIGNGWFCLVNIYIFKKNSFLLKETWHIISPSKIVIFHWVILQDTKYSVVYSSNRSMVGTKIGCVLLRNINFSDILHVIFLVASTRLLRPRFLYDLLIHRGRVTHSSISKQAIS